MIKIKRTYNGFKFGKFIYFRLLTKIFTKLNLQLLNFPKAKINKNEN